jgi:DNA excision repair protein ERCC-6
MQLFLGGVIVTTYAGVRSYREILVRRKWGYVVLDEGHKIRNPDSEVTLSCKQLKVLRSILNTMIGVFSDIDAVSF